MTSAIILAAGSSTRLGRPKQNLRMGNETLLERAMRIAHLADLSPVFVIVSPPESQAADHPGAEFGGIFNSKIEVLTNHHAAEGMASSIRLGVHAAIVGGVAGTVILACDQISVTPEHLCGLTGEGTEIRASSYAGRNGIPAYFPASFFAELLQLTGDTGARDLLRNAVAVPLHNGDLDIDTPADLARARELYPGITMR